MSRLALALILASALPAGAAAQPATLVGDLNPSPPAAGSPGSRPSQFAAASGRVVFATPGTGPENPSYVLWSTDGTAAGTETISLACSGLYCREPQKLATIGGLAFYAIGGSENQLLYRIWRTDGTRTGTFPVSPFLSSGDSFQPAAVLGRRLLFGGCVGSGHCSLWETDGLGDAEPLVDSTGLGGLVVAGDRAFFPVFGANGNSALWVTDGTAVGTRLVRDGVLPGLLTASGSRVFFLAGGDDAPDELWTSDGTRRGTVLLRKFAEPNHYFPPNTTFLKAVPGGVVFVGIQLGGPGINLWRSDGTRQGTRQLTAFQGNASVAGLQSGQIAAAGGRIFFVVEGLAGPRLWSTRGSLESTAPVPGSPAVVPGSPLLPAGSRIVFAGQDAAHGAEPWTSDGTGPGTHPLADLCAGSCGSSPRAFTPHGGIIDFRATWNGQTRLARTDGTTTAPLAPVPDGDSLQIDLADLGTRTFFAGFDAAHGSQPWVTDGTPAGSRRIASLESSGGSSDPADFTPYGNRLLFTASDGAQRSVWALSPGGSPAPLPGGGVPGASDLTVSGGIAYFVSDHGADGVELWRTDGTPAGTTRLLVLQDHEIGDLRDLGGTLAFLVSSTAGEQPIYSLWTSDGTPAGTGRRVSLPADTVSVSDVVALGSELYFVLHRETAAQIFRSDGTEAGTRMILQEACDCVYGGSPVSFLQYNGQVYFTAWADPYGISLLRTDGTAAGTVQVLPAPGDTSQRIADVQAPFVFQGELYFIARNSAHPDNSISRILWKGWTPAEAAPVKTIGFQFWDVVDPRWTVLGNRLFLRASDLAHGTELWRTDGTATGTVIVRDFNPGPNSGDPQDLVAAGGRLWFSALDPVHGRELWTSNGTRKGTRLVQDLAPGALSSAPEGMTPFAGWLYFSADDGVVGREPWRVESHSVFVP